MSYTSDAADQIVKWSLKGLSSAIRITGSGAVGLAKLIGAAMRSSGGLRGKEKLAGLLSGKEDVKIFGIDKKSVREFSPLAQKFGIDYCTMKSSEDGMVYIMVKKSDSVRTGRLLSGITDNILTPDRAEKYFVSSRASNDIVEAGKDGPRNKGALFLQEATGSISTEDRDINPFMFADGKEGMFGSFSEKTEEIPGLTSRCPAAGRREVSVRDELRRLMNEQKSRGGISRTDIER